MHMIKELTEKLNKMISLEMKEEVDKKDNKVKKRSNPKAYSSKSIDDAVEKLRQ